MRDKPTATRVENAGEQETIGPAAIRNMIDLHDKLLEQMNASEL